MIPMNISVIIPVYNEEACLPEIMRRVHAAGVFEVLAVDDGSTDGSWSVLQRIAGEMPEVRLQRHASNRGKGAAIRTAVPEVRGDIVIIQDADLEYDPAEYPELVRPIEAGEADAVYGSRILGDNPASYTRYYWGGRFLTWATNALFGSRLTDTHTCYKVFRTSVFRELPLREDRFGFCTEATSLLLIKGVRIVEVPISYHPRSMSEGKKIRWYDGLTALRVAFRIRFGGRSGEVKKIRSQEDKKSSS